MTFAASAWLGLLALVPVLWLVLWRAGRAADARLTRLLGPRAQRHVEHATATSRSWRRFFLLGAVTCLVLALARPQWGASEVTVVQRGTDVVVALDVSSSMLAEDVTPNRLIRARAELGTFLDGYDLGQVGLVLFAGQAFVQCPLTLDLGAVRLFLDMSDTDMISTQGTALAAALTTAADLLDGGEGGRPDVRRAVILVTDGEDLEGAWEEAAARCDERGITVFPVGVGTPEGSVIPETEGGGGVIKDPQGNVVVSRLDLASLEKLAEASGGSVFRIGPGPLDRERLHRLLSGLGARDLQDRRISAFKERYAWPLALALIFLLARFLIRPRGVSTPALALLALVALALPADARAVDLLDRQAAAVAEGADLYRDGRYGEALARFQKLRAERPDDPRLALAVGEALWRLDRHEEAAREFTRALSLSDDPDLRAESLYNLGTTSLASGQPDAAAQALREAAALDPDRPDVLTNLELAQRMLEMAQQQQDQQEGDQQQDQQQQDRQDQQQQDRQDQQQQGDQDQQDQQSKDQQQQEDQQPDDQQQDDQQQDQQSQEDQQQQDQQEQGNDEPQPQDQQDQSQEQPEPKPGEQEVTPESMSKERAESILKGMDREEEELKRSLKQRLKGAKPRSGRRW
ncbi:MAG TPA: VWA domain-containing protein [Candidatus Krumholzibacteria bacterium]|nr:VWA domain-containing protein [Candidatus Krumholzibacteria bacterium]HRX51714.1 VWA domain-containing protein [Candidatus Krumholzibacteria bacterium]